MDPFNGGAGGGVPATISLAKFQAEYLGNRAFMDRLEAADIAGCSAAYLKLVKYWQLNAANWAKLDGSQHRLLFSTSLEPLTNYQVVVTEKYNGASTSLTCAAGQKATGSCAVEFDPTNDILSNSQGFLATTLPGYTYARATVPGSTDSVLQVDSTKPARVAVAAVFNVRIPIPYLESP
jgi:hypothetical protein